jgi:Protein of unknown function (DUF2510)
MRVDDAPPAGWYPDPDRGTRLRYWDGLDWTDRFHSRPVAATYEEMAAVQDTLDAATRAAAGVGAGMGRNDVDRVIAEVRDVARTEVERAADVFSQRAQTAARSFEPIVSSYVNRFTRWIRWIAVLVLVLVVGFYLLQAIGVASFLDWLGDRIDSLQQS